MRCNKAYQILYLCKCTLILKIKKKIPQICAIWEMFSCIWTDKLKIGKEVVIFSAEDLYFFEKDEIELKTGHAFLSCLSTRIPCSKHKQCLSVTLLIKTDDLIHRINLCGPTQMHLRERSIGTLWNALRREFGKIAR